MMEKEQKKMDVVVTVPQRFGLDAWIQEGDPAGKAEWSGNEWHFYLGGSPPRIEPGERVYIVYKEAVRGYAPLVRIDKEGRQYGLVRHGGAVAVSVPFAVPGFRGFRYRWWEREQELPFPDWQAPDAALFERYITFPLLVQCQCCGEWFSTYSFAASQKGYCEACALERFGTGKAQCKYCHEYPSNHWLEPKPESREVSPNEELMGGTRQTHMAILAAMVAEGRRRRAEGSSAFEEGQYVRQVRDAMIQMLEQNRTLYYQYKQSSILCTRTRPAGFDGATLGRSC